MTAEPLHRIPLHFIGSAEEVARYEAGYKFYEISRFAVRPTGVVFFPLCASPIVRVLFLGLPSLCVSYVSAFLAQAMSPEGRVAATMANTRSQRTAVVGESLPAVALLSFHGSAKGVVNGENAMVVADNDTEAFAATIERLLADDALATRLGEAGRRFAHETLIWSSAAERIENVHRGLV